MTESNEIEGEYQLNPNDEEVFETACMGIVDDADILHMHDRITEHLGVEWGGRYRLVDVRVGRSIPPPHHEVPAIMHEFFDMLPGMDSWTAHNTFEHIHPFRDFNGRIGRLIWASKAQEEGFTFKIPFLQKYYYQTLEHTKGV